MKIATLMASTSLALMVGSAPALAQNAEDGDMREKGETIDAGERQDPAAAGNAATAPSGGADRNAASDGTATEDGAQRSADAAGGPDEGIAGDAPVVAISDWGYDRIYSEGWSYDVMTDTDVIGGSGEEIGEVENVVLDDEGQAVALIAEVGGFWDIGDTHVSVPWNEVEYTPMTEEVRIPVTEENVDDYGMMGEDGLFSWETDEGEQLVGNPDEVRPVDDDAMARQGYFKASDIVGDYAYLTGNERYGYVSDLVFTAGGQLHAVVVSAAAGYGGGYYAYPWRDRPAWNRADLGYQLPYGADDATVIETLDYERLRGGEGSMDAARRGTDAAADGGSASATGDGVDESQTSAVEQ